MRAHAAGAARGGAGRADGKECAPEQLGLDSPPSAAAAHPSQRVAHLRKCALAVNPRCHSWRWPPTAATSSGSCAWDCQPAAARSTAAASQPAVAATASSTKERPLPAATQAACRGRQRASLVRAAVVLLVDSAFDAAALRICASTTSTPAWRHRAKLFAAGCARATGHGTAVGGTGHPRPRHALGARLRSSRAACAMRAFNHLVLGSCCDVQGRHDARPKRRRRVHAVGGAGSAGRRCQRRVQHATGVPRSGWEGHPLSWTACSGNVCEPAQLQRVQLRRLRLGRHAICRQPSPRGACTPTTVPLGLGWSVLFIQQLLLHRASGKTSRLQRLWRGRCTCGEGRSLCREAPGGGTQ